MCVRACVRVFNCVSCSRDKENVRARREFYRERERERARARRKDFFRFFLISFLSCLVFVLSLSSKTSLSKKEARRKRRNYPTPKKGRLRGAVPFRTKRKKNNPLVVKSVKASVRSPLNDLAHREPQQHGSSCRRNLHLRAS